MSARVEQALADAERIEPGRFHDLRTLFAEYALRDSARMRDKLRRRDRSTLTAETVQLTELCISLRLDWVRHRSAQLNGRPSPVQWPPPAGDVEKRIRRIGRCRSWHWHEHYNAACAYALPLLDRSCSRTSTRSPGAPSAN